MTSQEEASSSLQKSLIDQTMSFKSMDVSWKVSVQGKSQHPTPAASSWDLPLVAGGSCPEHISGWDRSTVF